MRRSASVRFAPRKFTLKRSAPLRSHTAFGVLLPPVVPDSDALPYSGDILVVCHIGAPGVRLR